MRKQIKKGDKVVFRSTKHLADPTVHVVEYVRETPPGRASVLKLEGINGLVHAAAYVRVPKLSKKDRQIVELSKMLDEAKAAAQTASNNAHDQYRKQIALMHQMDSQLLGAGLVRIDFLHEHALKASMSSSGDMDGVRYHFEFTSKPGSTLMSRVATAIKGDQ